MNRYSIMKKAIFGITATVALAGTALAASLTSGLTKGQDVSPFHPKHVVGALANSEKCFPCTYKNRPQVQVWVNGDDVNNVLAIAKELNNAQNTFSGKEFKALVVFIAPESKQAALKKTLVDAAKKNNLEKVAMAMITPTDEAVKAYNINLKAKNTIIAYKDWKVTDTWVDVKASAAVSKALNASISKIAK